MLALLTDTEASHLASCSPRWTVTDCSQVGLLSGTFRIPPRARPLLRAALIACHQNPDPAAGVLLDDTDGALFLQQRMANVIARSTALAGVALPRAATDSGRGLAAPFAADLTTRASVSTAPQDTCRRIQTDPSNSSQLLTSRDAITDISCTSH